MHKARKVHRSYTTLTLTQQHTNINILIFDLPTLRLRFRYFYTYYSFSNCFSVFLCMLSLSVFLNVCLILRCSKVKWNLNDEKKSIQHTHTHKIKWQRNLTMHFEYSIQFRFFFISKIYNIFNFFLHFLCFLDFEHEKKVNENWRSEFLLRRRKKFSEKQWIHINCKLKKKEEIRMSISIDKNIE